VVRHLGQGGDVADGAEVAGRDDMNGGGPSRGCFWGPGRQDRPPYPYAGPVGEKSAHIQLGGLIEFARSTRV
jgi:hypothetical protein